MEIRLESPEDLQAIHQLTTDAFAPMSYSDGREPAIIDDLRAAGKLSLSLVTIKDDTLVAHVAFSPVTIGSNTDSCFGLGPVSVQPNLQRRGIGTALINEGLRVLKEMNADGCALIGDPKYYRRFGFVSDGSIHYQGASDEIVQWKSFNKRRPKGFLIFGPEFGS